MGWLESKTKLQTILTALRSIDDDLSAARDKLKLVDYPWMCQALDKAINRAMEVRHKVEEMREQTSDEKARLLIEAIKNAPDVMKTVDMITKPDGQRPNVITYSSASMKKQVVVTRVWSESDTPARVIGRTIEMKDL